MKKLLFSLVVMTVLSGGLFAQESSKENTDFKKWQVRFRAISIIPMESADIETIGGDVAITNIVVPELDFTYFFTNNIAAELILGTSKHSVETKHSSLVALGGPSDVTVDLGTVWLLPPTLTLQYYFATDKVRPYVGAGVNYTIFYGVNEGSVAQDIKYDNSFGLALQAGLDYDISDKFFVNVDLKYINIKTDVDVIVSDALTIPAEVKINPIVLGLGIGMKF